MTEMLTVSVVLHGPELCVYVTEMLTVSVSHSVEEPGRCLLYGDQLLTRCEYIRKGACIFIVQIQNMIKLKIMLCSVDMNCSCICLIVC